jgi:predicted nucleotidyltransferase
VKYPGIKEAVLYGSRAKENYRAGSDIDIALKTTPAFYRNDLLRISSDFDDSVFEQLPYKKAFL